MDLALNKQQRLICYNKQTSKQIKKQTAMPYITRTQRTEEQKVASSLFPRSVTSGLPRTIVV